ncbi:HNH endonuclease signature motif containing protein [Pelagibius sp. CAU 1746]|uniref:HNH endonuclease n=1 Tax=Pelagibius sp. CAU 1746 TaxID=3140370 RepID=UPI00325B0417
MDAPLAQQTQIKTSPRFVTEFDGVPGFWNFLLALDRDDLVAELVQNDLDQDATRTIISFERDWLICEGNGRPVEPDGWRRLAKIQGAGDTVPAKRGKIGVKNHGLKTAFTIGDEVRILSAGQTITQTLYARGRDKPPYPGASATPEPDSQAPATGCRILIHYRDRDIRPPVGEAIEYRAVAAAEIDALFIAACASTPEQFAGIVSPEIAPRYEIILRHWHLGEACFKFSCTRPQKIARRMETFHRRCVVSGTATSLPPDLREVTVRRLVPVAGALRKRAAGFYRRGSRVIVEVSWPVDGRGKPVAGTGRFRYPIGYPAGSHVARTGHGAYFSAPITSDAQRHGPSHNDAAYSSLRSACEALLVDALSYHAIPRWGADALNVLVPSPGSDNQDEAIRPLLAAIARGGAMPTLSWRERAKLLRKGKSRKQGTQQNDGLPKRTAEPRKYRFILPVLTWERAAISPPLALVSPRDERQLDPRIHPAVIELLSDGHTEGFQDEFVTFDENDVLDRVQGEGNEFFAACPAPDREFAQPVLARAYLDVIAAAINQGKCDSDTETALLQSLLLPDIHGKAMPFQKLHSSAALPADVPGLSLPPLLHQDLATHPLLSRSKWRRKRYTMMRFLESGNLDDADEATRWLFWRWLRQNPRAVGRQERARLADSAIWPDSAGALCTLSELCKPRSARIGAALGEAIRRPHEQVSHSKITATGTKGRATIRRVPTQEEISTWLRMRMEPFVLGTAPDPATSDALQRFEADLVTLLRDACIARMLKAAQVHLPARARNGLIRHRGELVMPSRAVDRLALPDRFLLSDKSRAAWLDRLSPALSAPSAAMLLAAFAEDPGNFDALQARLHHFLALTEPGDPDRLELAGMPIIPVHGQPRAPCTLAFVGPRGDYWGAWKARLQGTGLSQDDQSRYRAIGVTSALPSGETSRAFFKWLATADNRALEQHVGIVLRHILNRHAGPESWAITFTDTPFIPVRNRDGLRLVSLKTARRRPVFLPDVREITDAVIESDSGVLLVVDRVQEVTEPITEPLRRLGIRSLREELGEPEQVAGHGACEQAGERFLRTFAALRSRQLRRTLLKRLDELGVERDLVRRDWHDRLSRIRGIRFADGVEARYRLRGKPYSISAAAGFDVTSGTFWIKKGREAGIGTFCEAIAAQLIFKTTARPVHLLALEKALALEVHDPTFGRPATAEAFAQDDESEEDHDETAGEDQESQVADENDDDSADTGEAVFGHSPFDPDASRNIPKPRPLSARSGPPNQNHGQRKYRGDVDKNRNDAKPVPEIEKEHVEALKRDHYASHCQMCLCERPPEALAPAGSYIEWEEVRRRVIEAHHVDLKSAGGARHAGNLILLCKLHHDNFGRRLTREAVTTALQGTRTSKRLRFGVGGESPSEIDGQVVELVIPDTGEVVEIFFTQEHAAYWLANAGPVPGSAGDE